MSRKFDRFMVDVHIGTNRKIRRLSIAERWCHVAGILPVAAQAPIRGRLLIGTDEARPEDFSEQSGVSLAVARAAVEKLRSMGVIVFDEEHGCEQIHDWEDMNPDPRSDPTNSERQKRYRQRLQAKRDGASNGASNGAHNAPVTGVSNAAVTPVTRNAVTQGREEKRSKERAKALSSSARNGADPEKEKASEDDVLNCRLLAEFVKERFSKKRTVVKSQSAWLREMRLLRERDGNSAEEIKRLIVWLFTDPGKDATFWADVIQSPANLREHFAELWEKMARPSLQAVPEVESSQAFLARRGAA